jgi:hypothetical protein
MLIRTDEGKWINTDNIDSIIPDSEASCMILAITGHEAVIKTKESADHFAVRILTGQISNGHFPGMPHATAQIAAKSPTDVR